MAAGTEMSDTVAGLDLTRLDEWVAGYRKLMLGGLGAEVHAAGVFTGRDDQPYITVDDVASLLAAARAVQAVRVAVHLDDDEPINPPVVPGGYTDHFCDGWDAAVDHMRGLVRAALGTEQEGRGE